MGLYNKRTEENKLTVLSAGSSEEEKTIPHLPLPSGSHQQRCKVIQQR